MEFMKGQVQVAKSFTIIGGRQSNKYHDVNRIVIRAEGLAKQYEGRWLLPHLII
jgi:hypothetical protein